MDSLYIIVPAYNECENIGALIEDWYPIIEKYNGDSKSRLVVIDDGSKDDTYNVLCNIAESHDKLIVLTKKNEGHGPTLLYGYKFALKNGADYIFQTDSDGQTDPKEFHKFWKARKKYDAIIGSRRCREDGRIREFVEKVLCFLLWVIFGVKVPDANAPFRLMKSELVMKYIKRIPDDYNLPNVMFTTFFAYFKENIRFIQISFKPRQGGTNSINIKKIIGIGFKSIKDFVHFRNNM